MNENIHPNHIAKEHSMTPIRQGDVLLVPASVPEHTTPVERDAGRLILAYGEVTGHAHAIVADGPVILTDADNERFLRIVGKAADLVHEEHGTISVAPGDYRIVIHRQWTDDMAAVRVLD